MFIPGTSDMLENLLFFFRRIFWGPGFYRSESGIEKVAGDLMATYLNINII